MTERCPYCGFPMDTPELAHRFIHQQGEAIAENVKTIRKANEEIERLESIIQGLQDTLP